MRNYRLTRREMILKSVGAIGGLALAGCQNLSFLPKQQKGIKIGACDWSLRKGADSGAFETARQFGLDGVQVSLGTASDGMKLRKPDVQKEFLNEAKKNGVEVASIAIGELNNVPYKSEPETEEWVSDSIDVCKAMGCKVVLLAFFGKGDLKGDKKGTDVVVERLKRVSPKAEKAGVFLSIESWLSAEEHMDIINRVGSSALKVYYDVGNSKKAGYDIYKEIRRLGDNICEFHAKDYKGLFGKGEIDFVAVRKAMEDINYSGWIQIEPTNYGSMGWEKGFHYNVRYLRKIFGHKL
jgi:L-ribulose-5-phosphate 3-epimerase